MVSVARGRIARLFTQAELASRKGESLRADRYVGLARRIATRYNVRLAPEHRAQFCRSCLAYLRDGVSARTRLKGGRRVRTCLRCGRIYRTPLPRTPRTSMATPPPSAGNVEPIGVPVDELDEQEPDPEEGLDEA